MISPDLRTKLREVAPCEYASLNLRAAECSSILDALEGLERDNASLRQELAMIEAGYSPDAPKDMADVNRRLANLKHV